MIAPSVTPERRQRRQHRRGIRDLVQRYLWRVGARP